MKPVSVVKENPGILSRQALEGTGYGLLCRAFALQILSRMSVTDGLYRQLALEFAEEPEPAAPAGNEYHISLELILEALRKLEPSERTERVRTERLLERVETRLRERTNAPEQERPAPAEPRPTAVTLQNLLFQTVLQLSEAEKPFAFPRKTLSGAFLRAESAARAASAEAASHARSTSTEAAASGQKRRINSAFSSSNVLAFGQSGAPAEPTSVVRMDSRNKAEPESLHINAPDAARPAGVETIFPTGKPESESLHINAPDTAWPAGAETIFATGKPEPADGLSPSQIAEVVERTLECRLRKETGQQGGRQESSAEQKRRAPPAAVDQSAVTESFQEPKVSRSRTGEQSKMKNSRPVPTRSSEGKPEWGKNEPRRQEGTIGAEAGGDFHSLPANSDRKPGEPASQTHGFSSVNQDIRTSAAEKSGLAEHPEQISGVPEPGKPLSRSLRIPKTQELSKNISRETYIRESEELTLREFRTPEPDGGKTGLSRRDSPESLRQSARRTSEGLESGGPAGKAAKPPVSENTAVIPAVPPSSGAMGSPSAAGESAASAKPSVQNQAPTGERQVSGREGRFSAALQTHGLSPVSRDIRAAAPAEKPGPAEQLPPIFGAADSAVDMVYSPETLNLRKTSAENADLPEPVHYASKSEPSGKAARGTSTPVPSAICSPAAAEARSVPASLQGPAARQVFPKSAAEPRPPETQGAERQSSGLWSRAAEHSGHSRTAPTVNRDIRTAVPTGEQPIPARSPLWTFGVSEQTKFSSRPLTVGKTFSEEAGLPEKRKTAYVGKEPEPWELRATESDLPERPTPVLRRGSLTDGPARPGQSEPGRLTGKIENLPVQNHSEAGAAAPSISVAEVSAAAAGTDSAPVKPFQHEPPHAAELVFPQPMEPKSAMPQSVKPRSVEPKTVKPQSVKPKAVESRPVEPQTAKTRLAEPQVLTPLLYGDTAFPELAPFHPAEQNGKASDSASAVMPAMADLSPLRAGERTKNRSRGRGPMEAARMGSTPARAHTASHEVPPTTPHTFKSTHPKKLTPSRVTMPVSRDIRTAGCLAGAVPRGGAESAGESYADTGAPALEYAAAISIRQEPTQAPTPQMDSEYVKSLPAWAQNFLKNGPAAENPNAGSAFPAVARGISVLPDSGAETGQMRWSAPQRRPAELSLRQKEEPQTARPQEKLSDTEIRHMADKVYKLIEDRIRRERRRLDL